MKPTLLLFLMMIFYFTSSAQNKAADKKTPDYVITIKGDTMKCNISYPFIGASRYTFPGDEDSRELDVDSLIEYYIKRKDLRKKVVYRDESTKRQFMQVVENGTICLYQLQYTSYNGVSSYTTTEWYVSKGSNKAFGLKTSSLFLKKSREERKDDFAEMLKDHPEAYNKYITEKKFSFNAIRDIVQLYNTGSIPANIKPVKKSDDTY